MIVCLAIYPGHVFDLHWIRVVLIFMKERTVDVKTLDFSSMFHAMRYDHAYRTFVDHWRTEGVRIKMFIRYHLVPLSL